MQKLLAFARLDSLQSSMVDVARDEAAVAVMMASTTSCFPLLIASSKGVLSYLLPLLNVNFTIF